MQWELLVPWSEGSVPIWVIVILSLSEQRCLRWWNYGVAYLALHDIRAISVEPTIIWQDSVHNRTLWLSEQAPVILGG